MTNDDEVKNLLKHKEIELTTKVLRIFSKVISFMIEKEQQIIFIKKEKLDFLSKKILRKELQKLKNIDIFLKQLIDFKGFNEKELLEIMHVKELNFLYKQWNKEYEHSSKFLEKQRNSIRENSYFEEYLEFRTILPFIEKFPYSYLTFPKEDGVQRFVFYFYIFNETRKEAFLSLLKSGGIAKDLILLVEEQEPYKVVGGYAFGCSYKEGRLFRTTLYPGFVGINKTQQNIDFINHYHHLSLTPVNQHMLNYGIDCYKNYREIKVYEKDTVFTKKIEPKDLSLVLEGKVCDYVLKFRNEEIITKKFEFFCNLFEEHEKKILEKYHLYDTKAKKISLYFNKKFVSHHVFYYNDL